MNRHGRRAAKKMGAKGCAPVGDVVTITGGRLTDKNPNYGLPVNCYLCETPHQALGIARIEDKSGFSDLPLCSGCWSNDPAQNAAIYRKWLNAPDLEITEGGEATTEQVMALAEKMGAQEH